MKKADANEAGDGPRVSGVAPDQMLKVLRNLPKIEDYGEARIMPVFGGKLG